jgi:hypothetical protein
MERDLFHTDLDLITVMVMIRRVVEEIAVLTFNARQQGEIIKDLDF